MGTRSRREGTCPRPHGGIAQAPRPLGLGEPQAGRRGSAHASPARGARSARQRARSRRGRRALTIRGSGRPGPCHAIVLPAACTAGASVGSRPPWDSAEERGLRRARPGWPVRGWLPMGSGERGARGARARFFLAVPWALRAAGPDSAAGLLSGLCQGAGGRGAGVPGSPPGPSSAGLAAPDAACGSGRRRLPVSVTASSAREISMLAPSRRGPHPVTSHPPLPSGKRLLVSSPHSACGRVLSSPRLITEHLISALPQRGRGDAWEFLFTPFCTGAAC